MKRVFALARVRTRQYWFVDGFAEIGTGCVFLIQGCLWILISIFPPPLSGISTFAEEVFFIALILFGRVLVERAKDRVTYPRTGYVSYRALKSRWFWLLIVLSTLAGIVLVPVLTALGDKLQAVLELPLLTGVVIGMSLLGIWCYSMLERFLIFACSAFLLAGLLSLWSLPPHLAAGLHLSIMGLLLFASGRHVLRLYLLEHPRVQEE